MFQGDLQLERAHIVEWEFFDSRNAHGKAQSY